MAYHSLRRQMVAVIAVGIMGIVSGLAGCSKPPDNTTPLQPEGTPNPRTMVMPPAGTGGAAGVAPAGASTGAVSTRPGAGQ